MKIRIFGPSGSGKSYAAKQLSRVTGIKYYETDNMIWNREIEEKYSREDRNSNLLRIMKNENWIIEGAQFRWSFESFEDADVVYIIEPPLWLIQYRVLRRYLRMKMSTEKFNYVQNFNELIEMIKQNNRYYKKVRFELRECIKIIEDKVIFVENNLEIIDLVLDAFNC